MANYRFEDSNGTAVTLAQIDEEIREDYKLEPDEANFCQEYQLITEVGFSILLSQGGSGVTEILYKKWRKDCTLKDKFFEDHEAALKKYLYGKYRFVAWR